jgi:hypothetical protein
MSGAAGSSRGLETNAIEQCGKVIGYAVNDEEGRPMLVDAQGVPVRKDQSDRKPVPPRFDDAGNPVWAY